MRDSNGKYIKAGFSVSVYVPKFGAWVDGYVHKTAEDVWTASEFALVENSPLPKDGDFPVAEASTFSVWAKSEHIRRHDPAKEKPLDKEVQQDG
jgi:hypothetical protein